MSNSSVDINRGDAEPRLGERRAAHNDSVSDTDACHNVIQISALFVCTRAQKLWVLMQNFTTSAPAETHDSLMKEEAETGVWHQRSSFYLLFSVIFGENKKLPQREEDASPKSPSYSRRILKLPSAHRYVKMTVSCDQSPTS